MFVRLNSRISKANIDDVVPEGTFSIVVAKEYTTPLLGLRDSPISSIEQREALERGVRLGLSLLKQNVNVCFICAAGMSRSVTMACLVAALWEGTSFDFQFDKMLMKDSWISNPSPVRALAEHLFPEVREKVNERVQS